VCVWSLSVNVIFFRTASQIIFITNTSNSDASHKIHVVLEGSIRTFEFDTGRYFQYMPNPNLTTTDELRVNTYMG